MGGGEGVKFQRNIFFFILNHLKKKNGGLSRQGRSPGRDPTGGGGGVTGGGRGHLRGTGGGVKYPVQHPEWEEGG